MPAKSPVARSKQKRSTESATPPVRLIVKRGAEQRFDKLKAKTSGLDVEVTWDRREGDRRRTTESISGERRTVERRQRPPFTWELADFAVVVENDKG